MSEEQAAELLAKVAALQASADQHLFVLQAVLCGVGFIWGVQFLWMCLTAVRAKSWWG